MKRMILISLALVLVLPIIAFAQQASNPSPQDQARMRQDAALLEKQKRSAAVVGGLVNQTPEYQQGYSLRVEAVKQQEQATAARNQRWEEEAVQETANHPNTERQARNEQIDKLYKDMPHGKWGDRSKRDTAQNHIDTLQRENGVYVPPRPERPKPATPQMPSNFSVGGKQYNCVGNQCY